MNQKMPETPRPFETLPIARIVSAANHVFQFLRLCSLQALQTEPLAFPRQPQKRKPVRRVVVCPALVNRENYTWYTVKKR